MNAIRPLRRPTTPPQQHLPPRCTMPCSAGLRTTNEALGLSRCGRSDQMRTKAFTPPKLLFDDCPSLATPTLARWRATCLCRQSCRSPTYSSMYPLVRSPVRGCPLHQVRGLSSHVVHQSPSWADRDGVVRQNHAAYSPELSCFVHGRKGDRGDHWQAAALQGLSLPPCDSSVHDPRRE